MSLRDESRTGVKPPRVIKTLNLPRGGIRISTDETYMRAACLVLLVVTITISAFAEGEGRPGDSVQLRVPGTSDPYLAGMPPRTASSHGDRVPEESPVLVKVSLLRAASVTFAASGGVKHDPNDPLDSPNGFQQVRHEPENGISAIMAPIDSLVGVFLDDNPPDASDAPAPINFQRIRWDFVTLEPKLKQVFYIGNGTTKARLGGHKKEPVSRTFIVPQGATRLYLGTMDAYEWNNNQGAFDVVVSVTRTVAESDIAYANSKITYAKWSCLPNRARCTPDHSAIQPKGPKSYHVVLAAQEEWGASVPTTEGGKIAVHNVTGTICLAEQTGSEDECVGSQGTPGPAGHAFLAPDQPVGALIWTYRDGRTYFSVNGRSAEFAKHQGYFEFDVTVE